MCIRVSTATLSLAISAAVATHHIPLIRFQGTLPSELLSRRSALQRFGGYRHNVESANAEHVQSTDAEDLETIVDLEALEIGLTGIQNSISPASYFLVEVKIGSPAKAVQLVLDLGSSDLVVKQSSAYNPELSSSAQVDENSTFQIEYVTANASGAVVSDKVCLSGKCVAHQRFAYATDAAGLEGADGILGVGSPAEARVSGKTVLQDLAESGGYKHFAIGLSLRFAGDVDKSFLTIAEFSDLEKHYSGECVTVPLYDYRDYSMLASLSLSVNSTILQLDANPVVVLDSGATSMKIPGDVYDDLMGALIPDYKTACRLAGTKVRATVCECDKDIEIGDIIWNFDGKDGKSINITLVPDDYMVKKVLPIPGVQKAICVFWGLMPGPAEMPWWLLGTNVLRHTDVVFGAYGEDPTICPANNDKIANSDLEEDFPQLPSWLKTVTLFAVIGLSFVVIGLISIACAKRGRILKEAASVDTYASF